MIHLIPAPEAADGESQRAPSSSGLSAGDFDHFVREYHQRLLTISSRLLRCPEDAADALQDALLSAWFARRSFNGRSTVYTWLYRILKNSCLMKIRNRSTGKRQLERQAVHLDSSTQAELLQYRATVDSVECSEDGQLLKVKIDQLPAMYRQILLLREIEQLSTAEIASRLSISPSNVKTRLCRARAELRQSLSRLDFLHSAQVLPRRVGR